MSRILFSLLSGCLLCCIACSKDSLLTSPDARIRSSTDSLYFDTLFTTSGSITQSLRIYNPNDRKIMLSSIRLSGGTSSIFRININGEPGPEVHNIELEARDSLHIFVNASIPENNHLLPFILEDSILLEWNTTNSMAVKLSAWGQNAHYLREATLSGNQVWTNDLPYVILGALKIEKDAKLQINKGARIYCHANAPILVDGSLQVNGDTAVTDRVVFTNDRLDEPYKVFPGGWPGIYLSALSHDNTMGYTIIRNSYQGIISEGQQSNTGNKLTLTHCIIDNSWDAGILAINSSISASNTLISNCGKNLQLVYGGQYLFTHCTIASYNNLYLSHKEPVLLISDGITLNNILQTAPLNARFINTICWGDPGIVQNEVVAFKDGNNPFSIQFSHGLWRMQEVSPLISGDNMFTNLDPGFESTDAVSGLFNFRLKNGSPAIDKGLVTTLLTDLDGKPRNAGEPDLGAFEKQ